MLSAQATAGGQAPPSWPAGADMLRGGPGSSPQQLQGAAHMGLRLGGAASSPPGQEIPAAGGGQSDTTSGASQQTSLFPRFSPDAADVYAASGSAAQQQAAAAAAQQQHQHQQQAALKQNLQKLYGSLGLQHGSRSSLPDIQENEPQTSLPSDPPLAARLPPYGRPPATRALSDDDLFGMQDLPGGSAAGAVPTPQGLPGQPAAADLSLVGQLPAGQSQSRTLFVRNVDPSVPEDELRTLFEVSGETRRCRAAALRHREARMDLPGRCPVFVGPLSPLRCCAACARRSVESHGCGRCRRQLSKRNLLVCCLPSPAPPAPLPLAPPVTGLW